jgi:hypothetical protein
LNICWTENFHLFLNNTGHLVYLIYYFDTRFVSLLLKCRKNALDNVCLYFVSVSVISKCIVITPSRTLILRIDSCWMEPPGRKHCIRRETRKFQVCARGPWRLIISRSPSVIYCCFLPRKSLYCYTRRNFGWFRTFIIEGEMRTHPRFADCILLVIQLSNVFALMYREINNENDHTTLQNDLQNLEKWASD